MSASVIDDSRGHAALAPHAPELAEVLVGIASDIVLVTDRHGVIQRIALGGGEPIRTMADDWIGRAFIDTVGSDSRGKVGQLLADVARLGASRQRQINHLSPLGVDVPVAYSAIRLGSEGPVLIAGRDLTVMSAMQQRLLHAQAEMEREYWQRRQSETRYQMLFQIAAEPVLVVDATSFSIVDANRSAARLLGLPVAQLIGSRATASFDDSSAGTLVDSFASARASGRAIDCEALISSPQRRIRMSVTPLRTESSTTLLLRLRTLEGPSPAIAPSLVALAALSLDAIIITDRDGRVQWANPAFAELAQVEAEQGAAGEALARWLGSNANDGERLLNTVRMARIGRRLTTSLRGESGRVTAVELSASCLADDDDDARYGFIIRPVASTPTVLSADALRPDASIH